MQRDSDKGAFAYFANGGELSNDQDDGIGMVPFLPISPVGGTIQ